MNNIIKNRSIEKDFPIEGGFEAKGWGGSHKCNTLSLSVGYAQGGMSYFSGEHSSRGFYLYFSPCILSIERGYETRETIIGTGAKQLLKQSDRYSAKTLAELAAKVTPIEEELVKAYVAGEKSKVIELMNTLIPASVNPVVI
jgi:hypothetical protein